MTGPSPLGRKRAIECGHLFTVERDLRCGDILFKITAALRAENRHNIGTFMQQPRERDLPGPRALLRKALGIRMHPMAASLIVAISRQAALIIGAVIGVAFAMHR